MQDQIICNCTPVLTVDAIANNQHAVVKALGVTQELQWVRHSSNVELFVQEWLDMAHNFNR